MPVKILESAHNDIVDGWFFYDRQQHGLGDYFSDTIYSEIESLTLYAGIHPRRNGFFRALVKRFPYAIYYDIEDGEANVYAILDMRRDPDWIIAHLETLR